MGNLLGLCEDNLGLGAVEGVAGAESLYPGVQLGLLRPDNLFPGFQ